MLGQPSSGLMTFFAPNSSASVRGRSGQKRSRRRLQKRPRKRQQVEVPKLRMKVGHFTGSLPQVQERGMNRTRGTGEEIGRDVLRKVEIWTQLVLMPANAALVGSEEVAVAGTKFRLWSERGWGEGSQRDKLEDLVCQARSLFGPWLAMAIATEAM